MTAEQKGRERKEMTGAVKKTKNSSQIISFSTSASKNNNNSNNQLTAKQRTVLMAMKVSVDYKQIYQENLQYLYDHPDPTKQHQQQNKQSLFPPEEQSLLSENSFSLLRKVLSIKLKKQNQKQEEIQKEYKTRFKQWKTTLKEFERRDQQEFQIRNQIINNAIQEDFAFAQANFYGTLGGQSQQQQRSPNSLSYYSRRRGGGPIGDVVRSEEEMNIVLRNLMEQERLTLGTRWMNTLASIPEMSLEDEVEFLDSNHVCTGELLRLESTKEFELIRQWTKEERKVFVERYFQFPKMFGKIASFLPGRSAADCVKFYYCNKKELQLKKCPPRTSMKNIQLEPTDLPLNEPVAKKRATTAGGDGSLLPAIDTQAIGTWSTLLEGKFMEGLKAHGNNFSLIADYLDYQKSSQECKEHYRQLIAKQPDLLAALGRKTKEVAVMDQTAKSSLSKKPQFSHYWTKEEKRRIVEGIKQHGKDWERIAILIKTKSSNQAKKFYKKNRELFQDSSSGPRFGSGEPDETGQSTVGKDGGSDDYESGEEPYLFENGDFFSSTSATTSGTTTVSTSMEEPIDIEDHSMQVVKLPTLFL